MLLKKVIIKSYIKKVRELKNFIIYYPINDNSYIDSMDLYLNENLNRLLKKFNITLDEKIVIKIYNNIEVFHENIGYKNAPHWIVGSTTLTGIKIVSPLNPGNYHNYDSLMKVLIHEVIHKITLKINPDFKDIPLWIREGIAIFESNQISNEEITKAIKLGILRNIPNLEDLNSNKFYSMNGYFYSYTLIQFIINEYGYQRLIDIIKYPNNFSNILGEEEEFFQLWKKYLELLHQHY